jgi:DNA polymerase I
VPRLFLIDTFGFIFRAYHARARSGAPPMRTSTGIQTEAVYIFHNMVRRLREMQKPEFLAAVFESEGPTFRDEVFEAYKANRTETPPDLLAQIPWIRKTLEAMSIPVLEFPGFEADDVIGTIARRASEQGVDVVIVSSDKDMLQLVNDRVTMLNPMKDDMVFDAAETEKFMGVRPDQVADLLALKGDAVDNIPGAPGIGEKGALAIISKFGSVEGALEHAAEVERKMYRESLQNNRDLILLSKKLATIHTDVPIPYVPEQLATRAPDPAAMRELYQTLEFHRLLREMGTAPETPAQAEPLKTDYQTFATMDELVGWLPQSGPIAIATEEVMQDTMLAFAARPGEVRSIASKMIPEKVAEHPELVAHDAKALLHRFGDLPTLHHDVMLYGFLLNADPTGCSLASLAETHLNGRVDGELAARADTILQLFHKLRPAVEAAKLAELYETIDLPTLRVLARMEKLGVRVDPDQLKALSVRMDTEIARLSGEIYELSGRTFNINSPQQLGKVLFEDMQLPAPKGPKGKAISTAADVLEELALEHPIAGKVLEYRQIAKLKGTYADALPALIDPDSGRVHTTFNQIGAATGRLSSSNPNLQNIPIRTELGREIRAAFVPRAGWKLIVADYSQIELRLLAHMSRDAVLVEAFRNGEDIHTRTAAEVFGVPPLMITPEQRRNAKAVNFGIVYGQTGFGLAQAIGVDRKEAEQYIKAYFTRYSGVRRWLDATIAEVRRTGVAKTIHGRQRPIPDMDSRNPNARGFAERTAVNTPLQGTAADLIKLAMIRIDRKLESLQTKMLLQVHDELVFEAPPEEVDEVRVMVKADMEGVARLEVPLIVDVGVGENWRDAK